MLDTTAQRGSDLSVILPNNPGDGVWQAWGGAGLDYGGKKTEKPSNRVEDSLRGLFRELSGGVEAEGGPAGSGGGADDAAGGRAGTGANGGNGGTGTTSASVEALRTALADVSGPRFGMGKMDDAAEAMETILGERRSRRDRHEDCSLSMAPYWLVLLENVSGGAVVR